MFASTVRVRCKGNHLFGSTPNVKRHKFILDLGECVLSVWASTESANGADCKSAVNDTVGAAPTLPTIAFKYATVTNDRNCN